MTPSNPGRLKLVLVLLFAGLVLTGVLAVSNHRAISLLNQERSSRPVPLGAASEARLAEVERQVAEINGILDTVSEDTTARQREVLDNRMTEVERIVQTVVSSSDVERLANRLSTLEARVRRAPPVNAAPGAPKVLASAEVGQNLPPFLLIGTELRGGERFVSIAPIGTSSVAQVRLLRIGDSEGEWLLEFIGPDSVNFRVAGKLQQIQIP